MLKRFLPAAIALLGLLVVALGIATTTVWKQAPTVHAVAPPAGSSNVVITAPGVLDLVASDVTIRASAPGSRVVLTIGRDTDVAAWAAASPHRRVTGLSSWTRLATDSAPAVAPRSTATATAAPSATSTAAPSATATATSGAVAEGGASDGATAAGSAASAVAPDPAGSDMWLAQADGQNAATLTWANRPGRWSVLAVSVGADPSPPQLELSWPHRVTTPWLAPAIAFGGALILVGLGLLALMRAQTRSPQLVEAWSTGVPVRARIGTHSSGVPAPAPVPAAQSGLTRRQLREQERTGEDTPVVAAPGPFARLRARVVTRALGLLPPAVEQVAVPTRPRATRSAPSAPVPRSATPTSPGPAVPEPTGWSAAAPQVQRPAPQVQQPAAQVQQPTTTAGHRAAHSGQHAALRPAAPDQPPGTPRWGAPPPDAPALPLPPALVAPVASAGAQDQQAASSTRADAWRRAWGFPGTADSTDNAAEDVTEAEEGR